MNPQGTSKSTLLTRARGLIAGTQKHPPTGSVTIQGTEYTTATIVQPMQSLADALAAVDAANAAWKDALQKMVTIRETALPIMAGYRSWILATYGNAPATLADYGMTPRKTRTPLTAQATTVAVAKRTATRAARHTMGSRQKAAVKGDVTDVVVTPVTATGAAAAAAGATSMPTAGTSSPVAGAPSQGASAGAATPPRS